MKKKNLMTAALSVGGAILAAQSALGQTYAGPPSQANDLLFGFQNQAGGGTEDYVINLGQASTIVGKSTVVDLSGDFSLDDFNAVLNGGFSMYGGVIGAANVGNTTPNTADVYLTQARSGVGVPSTPGSSVSQTMSRAEDNTAYADLGTLFAPASGTGGLDTGKTWENLVDPAIGTGSFQANTGLNPDSQVSAFSPVYEDLWETTSSSISGQQGFTYLGYFTLDLTGANPVLTFTGKNVAGSLTGPTIISTTEVGTTVTIVSSGAVSGHSYQLQYTTSLSAPVTWNNVGSAVTASGSQVTNTDPAASGAHRFYRVQAQ